MAIKWCVIHKTRLRAAIFVTLVLLALQSLMPLAGELLVKNGWISSSHMQIVCSQSGIKFISTTELNDPSTQHSVKCPWCQLGEPAVLPSAHTVAIPSLAHFSDIIAFHAQRAQARPWQLAFARAPPSAA
jgi:hypothetical protein